MILFARLRLLDAQVFLAAVLTVLAATAACLPRVGIAGELHDLTFKASDGLKISAVWNHSPAKASRVIIVAPGFAQHKGTAVMKQLVQDLGAYGDVLNFDFRGTGKSEGLFYFGGREYKDLDGILYWARQNYRQVILMGFSLGAYTSIRAAATWPDRVDELYLISAPTSIDDIVWKGGAVGGAWDNLTNWDLLRRQEPGNMLFHWGNMFERKPSAVDLARDIQVPAHFLVGGRDHLISAQMSKKVYLGVDSPKTWMVFQKGLHAEAMADQNRKEFLEWVKSRLIP